MVVSMIAWPDRKLQYRAERPERFKRSRLPMENLLSAMFVGAVMAIVLAVKVGPLIATRKSDGPRIKRDYESNGRRVVEIERAGFEMGGRSSPGYRKYRIVVVSPLGGGRRGYVVGVSQTWFGDPDLKEY